MTKTADKSTNPVSQELEQSILACILLDLSGGCFLQASQRITPEDFGLDTHVKIYRAMQAIVDVGKPIDYYTLVARLQDVGELESCGIGYVTDLSSNTAGHIRLKNIDHYLDRLLEYSGRRTIIRAADSAMQRAADGDGVGDVSGELQERLNRITARAQAQTCVPVSAIVQEVATKLVQQNQSKQDFIGLPTGIRRLDRLLSGLVAGEYIVVAADPGGGKTSFALNVTEINCLDDNPVQFFSLEMRRDPLVLRLGSGLTGINHLKFRNGSWMSEDELDRACQAFENIKGWPLWIDDSGGLAPRELYARGRMQVAKGAKLIVVDYLQKIAAPGDSGYERATLASEAVRQLAKDTAVPVLCISQLSRRKDRASQKPELFDLRDSGAIEQDAHAVIMLWRPKENDNFTGKDALLVRKNRSGPVGEIAAKYESGTMKWTQDDSDLYADGKAASSQ